MKQHTPIRVILVDDHQNLRYTLKKLLGAYSDIEIVSEASDGLEAIQRCDEIQPDVILMDVFMPNMNGLDAARAIREKHKQISIILWTSYIDIENRVTESQIDVDCVFPKNITTEKLVDEIRSSVSKRRPSNKEEESLDTTEMPGFYKDLLENLHEGLYFVDTDRRITYWNKSAENITGYPASFAIGKHCRDNFLNHVTENGVELCNANCPLVATMQDGQKREVEVYLHHIDGHRVPVEVRVSPIRNMDGKIIGAVETFSNNSILLSARRRARQLQKTALTDSLTGVGNRRRIEARIKSELFAFQETDIPFGLLFCDIDHFKKFNDTYGHNTGDQVLKMVGNTLQGNIRITDDIGRWGGEEFVIFAENMDISRLNMLASKLLVLIAQSRFDTKTDHLAVTISIGGTLSRAGDTLDTIISRADQFMYEGKKAGRNRVTLG